MQTLQRHSVWPQCEAGTFLLWGNTVIHQSRGSASIKHQYFKEFILHTFPPIYKNLRPEYISISTCAFTPHNVKKDQDQRDVTDVILRHIFEPILQHMLHSDLASKWTFQSSARVCGKFEMSHCSQLSSSTVIITCFWQIKPGIQRSLSRHCNSWSVQTCRGEIS